MSKNFYWILICIIWLVGVVEDSLGEISNSNITQSKKNNSLDILTFYFRKFNGRKNR